MIMLRFGEHMVKGRNRGRFEQRMQQQITEAVKEFPSIVLSKAYGRIYISLNGTSYETIADRLTDIFGIASFSPVKRVESELEAIQEGALAVMRSLPDMPRSFKVAVRRGWKEFSYDSQQMNQLVGAHVLRATPDLTVDVHHPDIELRVEIQYGGTYIFNEVIAASGGYPYGSNGKAMLLLSGGIDSPVAGWQAMRKGLEIEAVHFHSYPFTTEQATEKVIELVKRLSHFIGRPIKLHLVPFTDIQTSFTGAKQDRLIITLMRRAMLRIAERIAEQSDALALITGDSLGQVASQTLGSMNVIGRTIRMPLLRPLIMMDKAEIIRIAERIGTYETSILPYEDCCTLFVPKSPTTNPNLKVVEKVESFIEGLEEMIVKAVEDTETILLTPQAKTQRQAAGEDHWF
jgi:thiamine biosynthesis protein ThiI